MADRSSFVEAMAAAAFTFAFVTAPSAKWFVPISPNSLIRTVLHLVRLKRPANELLYHQDI